MKRKNGEGTWGVKTIKGYEYQYFRDSSGKYYYGKTLNEVKKKIDQQKRIANTAKSVCDVAAKPSTILYDYIMAYFENIKNSIEPYTYYNYTHMVNNFLKKSKLGHKQLHQITPDMITNYYSELTDRYSYSTIVSLNKIIKPPIVAAEEEGLIKVYTAKKVRLPKQRYCRDTKVEHVPTPDEMKKIEEICFQIVPRSKKYKMKNNGLAFVFIMHTGVRIGELIALHWNDVDMEKRVIHINKSASFRVVNGKQVLDEKDPKSKSGFRTIPFDDTVYMILCYLKDNYPNHLNPNKDWVFTNRNGTYMSKATLEESMNINISSKILIDTSVERMGPHSLRKAYSSFLAKNKVNPKVISKLMGHSKTNITFDVYVDGYEEEMVEASGLFDNYKKSE